MAGQTNWDDLVGEINRLDSMAFRLVWRGKKVGGNKRKRKVELLRNRLCSLIVNCNQADE